MTERWRNSSRLWDVAQVDFDGGQGDPGNGISEGIGIMGEGAGIEEKAVRPGAGAVYFIDQHAFVVALNSTDFVFGPASSTSSRLIVSRVTCP